MPCTLCFSWSQWNTFSMCLYYTPKCQIDDAGMCLIKYSTHLESLAKIVCTSPNANCYLEDCEECPGIPKYTYNWKNSRLGYTLSWCSMVVSVCSRCDRPQLSLLAFLTPHGLSSTFKYPDQLVLCILHKSSMHNLLHIQFA